MACPVCPQGALPATFENEYQGKGEFHKMGGTDVYIVGDPKWESAIVLMHDVFGAHRGNTKAICDALARGGYYVVMPDFFEHGSIEPFYKSGEIEGGKKWLAKFDWAHCSAILKAVYAHLKEKGIKRTGSVGFCWGAWTVAKACMDPSTMQAGVWFHPSLQVDVVLFQGKTEHELTADVRSPTLICPSSQEAEFYRNGELKEIMNKNGVANDMVYFKEEKHGWMVRGSGPLGTPWEEVDGVKNLRSIIDVQRGVDLTLGFYAKHLFD
mmetsp:Transcript_8589/g.22157  ORF Transcript_8589/g.22157 Transcript_8589/m.22157 type:complete len:267 (-) Transcript_8589:112-912(-)|eukprot:CAMPEP_0198240176 /NCGR_PEP_ID=MMETSP1446-20131203/5373_1 /TAXON_ID=1461542 ORGANISM="Unidentified sp, Strain CCMP2111" /NCGR_SAMPLE_ID=MMETSP1446 /ASSEMBLY_ACC=CAM_ASM_001112 /LENGTH=266 /DNA_ID=CAMNT_0043922881 /DNA_START=310 /DNA_END=1110 /DNA_ORIENTATION=+